MQTFDELQFKRTAAEFLKEIERAENQIRILLGRDDLFGDGPQFNIMNARDMLRGANTKLDKLLELRNNTPPNITSTGLATPSEDRTGPAQDASR